MIWWLKWKYRLYREKFWVKLVYHSSIRLMVFACTGPYSNTVVPELGGMDAIGRWGKDKKI